MADFYRQVTKHLRKHFFVQIEGGKGSHEKWRNETEGLTLIVPRNLKSRHTANGIMRSANLPYRF